MKWDDFQKEKQRLHDICNDGQMWVITSIECPECGEFIYKNLSLILTSYPSQYSYKCPNCKWSATGY